MQYMYIHVCWHAFGHVYDLVGYFLYFNFLFLQKEKLIILLTLCWLAALSTYKEELQSKLFMSSIV